MNHKQVRKLLFHYVFGTLPVQQCREVEEHLALCEECRNETEQLKNATASFLETGKSTGKSTALSKVKRQEQVFRLSEEKFNETRQVLQQEYRHSIARQRENERREGKLQALFFPLWKQSEAVLKPAIILLLLFIISVFIYINAFSKPGESFSFNLPFSLLYTQEIS